MKNFTENLNKNVNINNIKCTKYKNYINSIHKSKDYEYYKNNWDIIIYKDMSLQFIDTDSFCDFFLGEDCCEYQNHHFIETLAFFFAVGNFFHVNRLFKNKDIIEKYSIKNTENIKIYRGLRNYNNEHKRISCWSYDKKYAKTFGNILLELELPKYSEHVLYDSKNDHFLNDGEQIVLLKPGKYNEILSYDLNN